MTAIYARKAFRPEGMDAVVRPAPPTGFGLASGAGREWSGAAARRRRVVVVLIVASAILLAAAAIVNFGSVVGSDLRSDTAKALPRDAKSPGAILPPVEPLEVLPIGPDAARAENALQPFVKGPLSLAKPFVFRGGDQARSLARDCLAAAAWYEAGNDAAGQSSVIQVVLNRVRHPAFPADICSVVFQGSERATGCQFSFTCDGSMARRRPSGGQWLRAQAAADRALSGFVDPRVGVATHYHTDWVVAYWSPKMEKLARVGTHLFFRWPGSYGRPRAFTRSGFAAEVPEQRMAGLSPAHALAVQSDKSLQPVDVAPRAGEAGSGGTTDYAARGRNFPQEYAAGTRDLKAQRVLWSDPPGQKFVLLLAPSGQASSYALTALALCRGKPQCEVLATHDPAANPAQLAAADRSDLAFRYRRSAGGGETAQWDCHLSPRPSPAQCL